ncbi:hypothetical protein D1814_09425 [Alteromonas sp. BL110]|nr:hypothetical protein D1814_09425 [Alteromonas sp. BL110]RKM82969.1 hypothetical protein D7031_03030 [Alteromonas sp. BL110]
MPKMLRSQFYTITESVLNFAVLFYRKAHLILVNILHLFLLSEGLNEGLSEEIIKNQSKHS